MVTQYGGSREFQCQRGFDAGRQRQAVGVLGDAVDLVASETLPDDAGAHGLETSRSAAEVGQRVARALVQPARHTVAAARPARVEPLPVGARVGAAADELGDERRLGTRAGNGPDTDGQQWRRGRRRTSASSAAPLVWIGAQQQQPGHRIRIYCRPAVIATAEFN